MLDNEFATDDGRIFTMEWDGPDEGRQESSCGSLGNLLKVIQPNHCLGCTVIGESHELPVDRKAEICSCEDIVHVGLPSGDFTRRANGSTSGSGFPEEWEEL